MCDKKMNKKEKAKKDLENSRERLHNTIQKGEDKLCQYIHRIMEKHIANVVPSDGKNHD